MSNYAEKIIFTPYSATSSVMTIDRERYFIIENEKKEQIVRFLQGENEECKEIFYKHLKNYVNKNDAYVSFQSFQYKRVILKEGAISKITKYFSFLFDKWVIAIVVFFVLLIDIVLVVVSPANSLDVKTMNFDYSWIVVLFVFFFHELGHATACTYYGVKSCSLGFGITLLMPVLYADVSSSWTLNTKERMIVNFGGIYFQNIFACFFMLLSVIVGNYNLFMLSKIVALSTIFQLFPFYKSDGYWILTDILHEPRLFVKSQSFFIDSFISRTIPKDRQGLILVSYYFVLQCFIMYFLIKTIFHYVPFLISLPFYLRDYFSNPINTYSLFTFEWQYCMAIVMFVFIMRIVVKNIKIFMHSDTHEFN